MATTFLMFLNAEQPKDSTPQYLEGLSTLVLVDAVVNTGKMIVDYVRRMKRLSPKFRMVIVAGRVQQGAIRERESLAKPLSRYNGLSLAALRVSENIFTDTKGADTGNRLFNTTHLD